MFIELMNTKLLNVYVKYIHIYSIFEIFKKN